MFESVNINSNVAVYAQIENHAQFAIASGRLKGGEQLPTVRELSERLGVNPNTVTRAYRDLEVMGLVYTRRGMGVFVAKGVEGKCRERIRGKLLARMHETAAEAKAAGLTLREAEAALRASYAVDPDPYGPTPEAVLALAKEKGASK